MSVIDQLKEMGFDAAKAEKAIKATGGSSLEQAMEWIIAQDEASKAGSSSAAQDTTASSSSAAAPAATERANDDVVPEDQKTAQGQLARSMKCDDCNKLFPNEDALVWHASKTGHANFSESHEEIKPKSPEELKAAKEALEARIKKNRSIRLEKERQEELEQEKARRSQGREIVELRQKFKEDEIKREAEARRREKLEDAAARKKILEQIERDREERRQRMNPSLGASTAKPATPAAPTVAPAAPTKSYDEARLQIRLTNGQTMTQTFKSTEALAVVRCYVLTNRTDGDVPFQLMTTFPKKIFSEDDMEKTLKELNLVPSAVLILSKIQ